MGPDTVGPTGDTPFYLSDMAVMFGPSLGGARGPSQGRSRPADETDIFNEKISASRTLGRGRCGGSRRLSITSHRASISWYPLLKMEFGLDEPFTRVRSENPQLCYSYKVNQTLCFNFCNSPQHKSLLTSSGVSSPRNGQLAFKPHFLVPKLSFSEGILCS